MQITFLSGYNNYQSRKMIYKNTYAEYLKLSNLLVGTISNVNFVPGDGVNTTQVFNNGFDLVPDYAVVADDDGNLVSRWFVVEYSRTRNGQYNVGLYRDVVVDALPTVLESTAFITKANVPTDNPLVFNNENLDLNQIKTAEYLLKDNSQCPWIVGYYARKNNQATTTLSGSGVSIADQQINFTVSDLSAWEYYRYKTTPFIGVPKSIRLSNPVHLNEEEAPYDNIYQDFYFTPDGTMTTAGGIRTKKDPSYAYLTTNRLILREANVPVQMRSRGKTLVDAAKATTGWNDTTATTNFLNLNGQILLDTTDNHAYRIKIVPTTTISGIEAPLGGSLELTIRSAYQSAGLSMYPLSNTDRAKTIIELVGASSYLLQLEYLPSTGLNYNITANRRFTADAPYDVFAIPYSDTFKFSGNSTTITCSSEVAMSVAADIGLTNDIYDLQLLPYCPFNTDGWPSGTYTSTDVTEYSWITGSDGAKLGVIFNVGSSSRTFNIAAPTTSYLQPTNLKMASATTFARLVSPNYNGEFQFSPARNNGVTYFAVDQTLKPFQPYIHVAPNWGGLYGNNYNDARGLVCGGDFSLPRTHDDWKQYELDNKNYQVMFDRQISNMEFNNRIQQTQDITSAIAGTITGIGAGAAGGAMIGGGVGGAIGGAIGGLASGITGIADVGFNRALRDEAIDYTKDQFGFQLGNIKARPNSLTKVGALNANNKLWPFIEIWTCTEEEEKAVAYKIAYNGMSVGVVDKLSSWLYNDWDVTLDDGTVIVSSRFIQAKLITFPGLNDESHFARVLANEMNIGKFWLGRSEQNGRT